MVKCCDFSEKEKCYDSEANQYYLVCKECGNFIEWLDEEDTSICEA